MKRRRIWLHLALPVLCLLLTGTAHAGVVFFLNQNGDLFGVQAPEVTDAASAMNALAAGPSAVWGAGGLTTAIPAGTTVQGLRVQGGTVSVDFSTFLIDRNFGEVTVENVFRQVVATLRQFGLGDDVKLTANGAPLYTYLPPTPAIAPKVVAEAQASAEAGTLSLSGHSITLSPGHGKYWNGSGWYTARPQYCPPLSEEDYHNIDNATYLKTYLEQDGMLVKMSRCTDKNYGASPYAGGEPWWHMGASYWLKNIGYPCSVYASYTGDCTLGSGSDESSDDIRARPLGADYDNTNIYISLHTNGSSGYCVGAGCPTGTDTYYDCCKEHRSWCTVSTNLSAAVHPALINAIRNDVGDSGWVDRGQHDSNGAYGEIRIPDRAAILIELGFHDTCDNDALHLQDPWWVSGAMWGIYKGVCDYFDTTPTWAFYSDEYVSDDIPAQLAPGETRQVHIAFRDKGVVWNEAHAIRLGAVGDSDPFSAATRYVISGDIAPGSTYTFTLSFTAPTTPGNYVTDWQMVRDGVTWFGATVTRSINVGGAPDTEPPTVPQNLQATVVSPTQVDLTWNASTDNVGVAGYNVYRNSIQIGSSPTTSYSDTTCSPNTTYTYEVSAYDGALNESGKSTPAVVTTPAVTDIVVDNTAATFTGSWSTGTSSGDKYGADYRYAGTAASETATAIWTPNIQLAGNYDVYCWYPQGSNRSTMAPYTVYWNGGSQTIQVNQQANGGMWNLLTAAKPFVAGTSGYVKLGNGTGESSLVVVADALRFVKVTVDTTPPVISNVASTPSQTTCRITWTTDESATSQVEYGLTTSYGNTTTLDPTLVTSHTVNLSGLARRTTYHCRVRSKDAAQNEGISGDYTFKTK